MIRIANKRDYKKIPEGCVIYNTTSKPIHDPRVMNIGNIVSPFFIRVPGVIMDNSGKLLEYKNVIMENLWQYSKVYDTFTHSGVISDSFFHWFDSGVRLNTPVRYPMGRGAKPKFSLYFNINTGKSERLNYIEARKKIYIPKYIEGVLASPGFDALRDTILSQLQEGKNIYFLDFDTPGDSETCIELYTPEYYDHIVNDPTRKMGHATVLRELLVVVVGNAPDARGPADGYHANN